MEKCIHNLWKISVVGPVVLQPEISHAHAPIRRAHALILCVCAVLEYSLASFSFLVESAFSTVQSLTFAPVLFKVRMELPSIERKCFELKFVIVGKLQLFPIESPFCTVFSC